MKLVQIYIEQIQSIYYLKIKAVQYILMILIVTILPFNRTRSTQAEQQQYVGSATLYLFIKEARFDLK